MSFDQFWSWVQSHPNCILRLGTIDSIVYDHEDHHWRFGVEQKGTAYVQMVRGKRIISEVLINPNEITYVSHEAGETGEEYFFDLHDESHRVLFYFVLSHGTDEEEEPAANQWN